MSETPENGGLAAELVSMSRKVLHLFADVGRGYGLTQQQVELLCAVIVPGRIRMSELGKELQMEKSGLSNLVDRAEQRGLVARTRDVQDRRATWVELTSEGSRLAMQTYSDVTARMARLVERVPREEQKRLAAVVKTIKDGSS